MTAGATVSTLAPRARRKMQPPAPPDPQTQYALDVTAGRILAGVLVKKAAERHLRDLATGHERGLSWDPKAAARAVTFAGMLRHYKGEWGPMAGVRRQGLPITLEAWQQFILGLAFGWKRADGTRRFRSVYIEVAKKNGKTLLAAIIGILLAFFDNEPGAEVYSVATKRDQAKLSWTDAVHMVRANPELAKRLETLALTLTDLKTASFFRPLGRDSDSDQGINPHGAIVDELHVLDDRGMIDNIETATSARRQPMVVKITTAGVRKAESVWMQERADALAVVEGRATDDSMLVLIYTLDEGDDPFNEAVWPKSNPNLGVSVKVDTLREQAEKAKRSPGKVAAFLRFRMNIPTGVATAAIDLDEWDKNSAEPIIPAGAFVYGGLDLASVKDLTALILIHRDADGFYNLECFFWCPEEGIEQRSRNDGVPYADWARDGFLIATPGNVTDYSYVEKQLQDSAEERAIAEVGYDRWNATQLVTNLTADGATMIPISQTHAGLAAGWRELEKAVLEHKIRHGGNPVLRWMAGNVQVETDSAGNQKPSKAHSSERIDGMVGATMAVGRWVAAGEPAVWTAA